MIQKLWPKKIKSLLLSFRNGWSSGAGNDDTQQQRIQHELWGHVLQLHQDHGHQSPAHDPGTVSISLQDVHEKEKHPEGRHNICCWRSSKKKFQSWQVLKMQTQPQLQICHRVEKCICLHERNQSESEEGLANFAINIIRWQSRGQSMKNQVDGCENPEAAPVSGVEGMLPSKRPVKESESHGHFRGKGTAVKKEEPHQTRGRHQKPKPPKDQNFKGSSSVSATSHAVLQVIKFLHGCELPANNSSCLDLTISILPSDLPSSFAVSAPGVMRNLDINQVPAEDEEEWRMKMARMMKCDDIDNQEDVMNNSISCDGHASTGSCIGSEEWKVGRRGPGGASAKKLRLSKEQSCLLEECFRLNHTLNPVNLFSIIYQLQFFIKKVIYISGSTLLLFGQQKQKEALALQLNLTPRQVEVWFQNRRARSKLRQTEMECEHLKRWFGSLREQNMRLLRELEQLRAMKVDDPATMLSPGIFEHPFPSSSLTMCPRCLR
ncbi:Homeobox-leucine zipper protein HOX3-like protein, partial [Drosera capensis]